MGLLKPINTLVAEIEKGAAVETRPSDAYRAALTVLRQQYDGYSEKIWQDLSPAVTRSMRAARRRLRYDIAILEAFLARAIRNNL